jgi:hypothetical protein
MDRRSFLGAAGGAAAATLVGGACEHASAQIARSSIAAGAAVATTAGTVRGLAFPTRFGLQGRPVRRLDRRPLYRTTNDAIAAARTLRKVRRVS